MLIQRLLRCILVDKPFLTLQAGSMPERWQAGHIFSASQMPGGGLLVAASCSDGALRTWSLSSSHDSLEACTVCTPHSQGMGSCCAWDPNGYQVASLATDGTLALVVGISPPLIQLLYHAPLSGRQSSEHLLPSDCRYSGRRVA